MHEQLHPDVASVLAGKRLLLFGELLAAVGFPKADVLIHLLCTGFPLTGIFPKTEVMPPVEREPAMDVQDLWRRADLIRREVAAGCTGP